MFGKPSTCIPRKVRGPSTHLSFRLTRRNAPEIDPIEGAEDSIEASCIDDIVELVILIPTS